MKVVTNDSFQGLEVYFITETGVKSYWLAPKESVVVPNPYISKIVHSLQRRKMVTVKDYN